MSDGAAWLDLPGPVRPGEELDANALDAYLHDAIPSLDPGHLNVEQYPSGFSNLTYLVRVADRSLILRRPPPGVNIASAHDMGREYRILSHLRPVYPKVPEPLAYCEDTEILGTPFYLMERVEGVILRKGIPDEMVPSPVLTARIADELVDTLAQLHAVDYEAAGLGELGRPAGYVTRQIEGWSKRYEKAETHSVAEAGKVSAWLRDSIPSGTHASLIHNDFKHDNVVLDPADWSRIIAVLDWEMATLGDPLMDLGTSLAYWIQGDDPPEVLSTRLSPTLWPGTPSRADIVERYARASGRDVPDIVFYYAYGLFKVAVIVQQLHARYVRGHTQDARYASLDEGVRSLCGLAWQSIQKGRIDDLY
ncbi:MAG: phosphotransferase family protein [Gemmatimonadota bacterium]|nr:phosphotransferase family protein [Gemmatimonadota bacterium]MDH3421606.1 phosphotransferase family protein [Gemmatimonadota bacterium]